MNDNSSQSMTVWDSLHSLRDYEWLLFCCDCLGSDLQVTHFWFANELRMPADDSPTNLNWTEMNWSSEFSYEW
jgi:hypothetical protein